MEDPEDRASTRQELDIHDSVIETWLATAKQIGVSDRDLPRFKRQIIDSAPLVGGLGDVSTGDESIDWKSRYRALEFGAKMAKGEFARFRERVLQQILDVVI